ncbi:hypothetical protein ES705_51137 [subsurface metagenome]
MTTSRASSAPEPSIAVAVTVIVPLSFAVNRPFALIDAMLLSLTLQTTSFTLASASSTSAFICKVPFSVSISADPPLAVTVTDVTSTKVPCT